MRIEESSGKPRRRMGYLLWPLVAAASYCHGGEAVPTREETTILAPAQQSNRDPGSASMTFRSDRMGHFSGTVMINNVPMPFMIDTGATTTVVPKDMAVSAKLPKGRNVATLTAAGRVIDTETKIGSLKIGNMEINNLDARISDYLNFVLIGMNTLKYFRMTQTGDTLTLATGNSSVIRNTEPETGESKAFVADPLVKKTPTLKKTVICDEHKVCKTAYSDH